MPDELADEFIKEADLNGDGKIDYAGILSKISICGPLYLWPVASSGISGLSQLLVR